LDRLETKGKGELLHLGNGIMWYDTPRYAFQEVGYRSSVLSICDMDHAVLSLAENITNSFWDRPASPSNKYSHPVCRAAK
jgi:hypothetical protein